MKKIGQEALVYLKGLFLSLVVSVFFTAYGSIKVTAEFSYSQYIVPFLAGFIMWTLLYIITLILRGLVSNVEIELEMSLLALFIVSLILGYLLILVGGYLVPKTWVIFDNSDDFSLAVGFVYAVILIISKYEPKTLS